MKKDRKRMIWLVLLVMYMAFIYSNSLTPAVESSRQSGRVLLMVQNFWKALE